MASNDTRDIYIWVNYTLSGTPPSLSLNLNLKESKKLIEDDLDLLKKNPLKGFCYLRKNQFHMTRGQIAV